MRYFFSSIYSRPNSNILVAVVVLHATTIAQKIIPKGLFKSANMETAAKKQNGSNPYPRLLAHVNNSTYCPLLLRRLIIMNIPMHPVSPKP